MPGRLPAAVKVGAGYNVLLLQKSQELLPLHVAFQIPILILGLHDVIHDFYPVCFFRKAPCACASLLRILKCLCDCGFQDGILKAALPAFLQMGSTGIHFRRIAVLRVYL